MSMVLSMTPLHLLGHSDENEVKHELLSYVMPLVPALQSCYEISIIIAPVCSLGEDNCNKVWCWHHIILIASPIAPLHLLVQGD